ncbi:MAG: [protein-PII] uridylyltransferase [Acidobacteria bacterium]|nr:[protein-PII] uridylyltransferase [Acidobacteriota bacterium]MBS1865939.1 [protein-PII] uridylyltransferase [Acidobacteriota bacterium]
MTGPGISLSVLGSRCERERARIRKEFENGVGARETLHALCDLADEVLQKVFQDALRLHNSSAEGLSLLALGGYGRRMLFPYSDLDILFLFANDKAEEESRSLISEFSRAMWDLGFRVSSAGRTIDECKRIEEDNAEFHLALLDRRFLDGDKALFEKLDARILPPSERQARPFLFAQLHRLTKERLARYGNTIFHLEPNVKEAPGGIRDYQAAYWLRQILGDRKDLRGSSAAEEQLSADAVEFQSSIRCFLHYSNGRNDNALTYELQAEAAEKSLGIDGGEQRTAAEWMRIYFRHARTLNRQLLRYLDQKMTAPLSLKERFFSAARSVTKNEPLASGDYCIRSGQIEVLNQQALSDRAVMYSIFAEAARTGTPLAPQAERSISYIMTHSELPVINQAIEWDTLKEILAGDFPGVALRPMHRLGLLTEILPEFRAIDSLVVRDFYHRYTVDEHSLRTIEHLQELADPPDERGVSFAPLWKTLDRRDLLIFALLLHDTGKGMPAENHVTGSLEALETAAHRLGLTTEEEAEVHFLIEQHLVMSATVQRRDIFDPSIVSGFAEAVGTLERLQRLTLLTYADIHAVNPEALTPWKAQMLWQLFVATSNHFSRTLDRNRLHASDEKSMLEQVRALMPNTKTADLERFLEGFPRRYLAVHSAAEIARHFAMYQNLGSTPLQTELISERHGFSLTLLTADRPALFSTISGVLAAWGMNIIKADAFANAAGVVLDTFHFADLHRTLELNPTEKERFMTSLHDVLQNRAALEPLLQSRDAASRTRPPKVAVQTRLSFDDSASAHSTLLEVVVQDRPGLLYDIGSALTRLGCNIEVALIDTEGQKAIDVFYLTSQGKKLTAQKQELLKEVLQGTLG